MYYTKNEKLAYTSAPLPFDKAILSPGYVGKYWHTNLPVYLLIPIVVIYFILFIPIKPKEMEDTSGLGL